MINDAGVSLSSRYGRILLMGIMLLMSACVAHESRNPLATAGSIDLARYTGKWYEIARLPMWAQRNCISSTAEYRLLDSGDVGVRNACVTKSGKQLDINGIATVVDRENHAKLNVVFDQWAARLVAWLSPSERGNYWILRIDSDYRWVVVGTPDREYLWILSRTPTIEEPVYRELVAFGQQLGFPTERLIRAPVTP
ncbi:lipocalin family protein [Petrachloros mirabilis]